jgi:hypothetical protein
MWGEVGKLSRGLAAGGTRKCSAGTWAVYLGILGFFWLEQAHRYADSGSRFISSKFVLLSLQFSLPKMMAQKIYWKDSFKCELI